MVLRRILLDQPSKHLWNSSCEPLGVHKPLVENPWSNKRG
ncbi:hypothetical protein E2C01_042513 [Portunus trituberculatus]|uniref:Uncharacterized protein n=1 Tax=Portunus trituberculatus TaxID=210409 RepID=A0A5B7FML5_PORTR|nr:hypothetical protein [Portunus trituberculatus]